MTKVEFFVKSPRKSKYRKDFDYKSYSSPYSYDVVVETSSNKNIRDFEFRLWKKKPKSMLKKTTRGNQ